MKALSEATRVLVDCKQRWLEQARVIAASPVGGGVLP